MFPFFRPYWHTLIVSPMSPNLKFSLQGMYVYQRFKSLPASISQFSVAAMSVDCYLSHSSSDLNQRWRPQKILNALPPSPRSTEKSAHYRLKASLTPRVILRYRGAKGGGQWRVARGWRKMSRGLSFSPRFRLRRACSQALLYTYLFNCGY